MNLQGLGLGLVLALVLVLPFAVRRVEEELELFLLSAGLLAVSLSHQWAGSLVSAALLQPLPLTVAVGLGGLASHLSRRRLESALAWAAASTGRPAVVFMLVVGLGMVSALVSAVVAALALAEALALLSLGQKARVGVAVLGCYAIGLGSALSALGGPLAAIVLGRMAGGGPALAPLFLLKLLGGVALPLMGAMGLAAAWLARGTDGGPMPRGGAGREGYRGIGFRTLKIYAFVAGLVLLGQGFSSVMERLMPSLSNGALFWINASSALLDNATLAAAEVSPGLDPGKLKALLLGLMLAGGMLIPGNIPNIVCAAKLGVRSRDWALWGVPIGLGLMLLIYLSSGCCPF